MKIYDITKTRVLENYDLNLGYLTEDTITKNYPEIKSVKEQGHYETTGTNPDGTNKLKWIIDVPGVSYQPARIETEQIQVYIPYTTEQLTKKARKKEMGDLQDWFDKYYAEHEQKYRRLIALGKLCDDGTNPSTQLTNLYLLAESNRLKINELEELL